MVISFILGALLTILIATYYLFDRENFNDGYNDCILHYSVEKNLIEYEKPQNNYERGWNKAVKDIYFKKTIKK